MVGGVLVVDHGAVVEAMGFEEASGDQQVRGAVGEVRLQRAENGGGAAALLRCQQRGQPSWCRHLVVVDEGDKGAVLRGGRIERRIAREGDAAARLGDIVQRPGEAFRRRRDLNARLAVGTVVDRSEEHTSELQSLMRISYAVFCLKKTK